MYERGKMEERNENKAGLYRVLVCLISFVGIVLVLGSIYQLLLLRKNYLMFHNPYLLDIVPIFIGAIIIGVLLLVGAIKLYHHLLPNERDIEKRQKAKALKEQKAESEAQKLQAERIRLAAERTAAFEKEMEKERQENLKKESLQGDQGGGRQYEDEQARAARLSHVYGEDEAIEIVFFKGPFIELYVAIFVGIGIMIASAFLMYNYVTQFDALSSGMQSEKGTSIYYWKIAGFVVLFWIGVFFWLLGKTYDYMVSTSCIAKYLGRIYLVGSKKAIAHEENGRRFIKSAGTVGKAIDAAATKIEKDEARKAILLEFKDPNFPELAKRIITAAEYHKYLGAYELASYKHLAKTLKKYLLHLYNKSK